MKFQPSWTLSLLLGVGLITAAAIQPLRAADPDLPWWKGNLHAHSLWSDGDDFPEMIVDWYKTHGYHFMALTDHNILQVGDKWVSVTKRKHGMQALEKYLRRFGPDWVRMRARNDIQEVKLRTYQEFAPVFQEEGKFLLMLGEEITDRHRTLPLHLNTYNLMELIPPQKGTGVVDVLQRNVDEVLRQRQRTGRIMVPHVNHPNFGYAITVEQLMKVRGERFFEVYNGHPSVHNEGDRYHHGLDRVWDIMLAFRLTRLNLGPVYGLAVDDGHNYHERTSSLSNPGRGWVMVQAAELTPQAILGAMEKGRFYASTGVQLKNLSRGEKALSLSIAAQPGVTYTTQFIGTPCDFDDSSKARPRPPGGSFPVSRQYSDDIGQVLMEVTGPEARYEFKGHELYVRAKILSSRDKDNPYRAGEKEAAWIQPVFPPKAD